LEAVVVVAIQPNKWPLQWVYVVWLGERWSDQDLLGAKLSIQGLHKDLWDNTYKIIN